MSRPAEQQPTEYSQNKGGLLLSAAFVVILLLTLFVHIYIYGAPPYLDIWDHATVARMILQGGHMYVDAFNEKGPGIYWISAGLLTVFGDRIVVLQAAATCGILMSLLLIFSAGARMGSPAAGLLGAALFALGHLPVQGNAWQSESIITPLFLASLVLMMSAGRMRGSAVFVGLALFITTVVKQTAWIAVPFFGAFLIAECLGRSRQGAVRRLIGFSLGLAVPWALVLLLQYGFGELNTFLEGYFFPVAQYVTEYYVFISAGWHFWLLLPIWWMALCCLLLAGFGPGTRRDRLLVAGMVAVSVLMMLPAMFLYHFPPILAFSGLGFGLLVCGRYPGERPLRWIALAGLLVISAVTVFKIPCSHMLNELRPLESRPSDIVAERVSELTDPGDRISIVPYNSQYFYRTDTFPPGRHTFLLPWTTPPRSLNEYMGALKEHPPEAILYNYFEMCVTNRVLLKQYLAPALEKIAEDYRIVDVYGNGVVLLIPIEDLPQDSIGDGSRERAMLFSDVQCLEMAPKAANNEFSLEDIVR